MKFNELRYQDSRTRTYLGSPSITHLPNGDLLGSHDYFGPGAPGNTQGVSHMSSLYRSRDAGQTWENSSHVSGAVWANLFVHRSNVYLIGVSHEFGDIVIRKSEDNGYTWTHPEDSRTGLLYKGGTGRELPNYHGSGMPVLSHEGRMFTTFENALSPGVFLPGRKAVRGITGIQAFIISINEDDDLLNSENWTMSNHLDLGPKHVPIGWPEPEDLNWREGNVVVAPNGEIWSLMCIKAIPQIEKAAILKVDPEGKQISFDPNTGFIDFPGGMTRFIIRKDEISGTYWTISNPNTCQAFVNQRNVLALYESADLINWDHRATLIEDDLGLSPEESAKFTGFQYALWQFDGDDMIFLLRTAYDGAHNFHDANRITFHRLRDFRNISE